MKTQTLTSLALGSTEAAAVLQAYGLHYCCQGQITLADACAERGIDPAAVVAALERAISARPDMASSVDQLDTPELIAHLRDEHDMHLRARIPFVAPLAARVANQARARDPRLDEVRDLTMVLRRMLESHLDEEEDGLFRLLADGRTPGADQLDAVGHEHRELGATLDRLRSLTDGYRAPSWACDCHHTLLAWLQEIETNVMHDVHLEAHVLLPRSACSNMEQAALLEHLVSRYHSSFNNLPFLRTLASKVAGVHGDRDPRLVELNEIVATLADTLEAHIDDVQATLTPDDGRRGADLVASTRDAHDALGEELGRMRAATEGFAVPGWACSSFRTLFRELERLETDVIDWVRLENRELLPQLAGDSRGVGSR